MIIRPYTSGTMQVSWRRIIESEFRDLIREIVGRKWAPQHVPPDYTKPREEIDSLYNSVVWLHPRSHVPGPGWSSASGVGFYIPRNLRLIHDSDFVLSCIYPGYTSIDSAHEIGVAYAWGKPIVTVDLTGGLGDYAAWRAMSLVVLDTLQEAAQFLLYQVQEDYLAVDADLLAAVSAVGDKLNAQKSGEESLTL